MGSRPATEWCRMGIIVLLAPGYIMISAVVLSFSGLGGEGSVQAARSRWTMGAERA